MAEEKKRRKKVTGDAKHRTGEYRAAVKPGTQNPANAQAQQPAQAQQATQAQQPAQAASNVTAAAQAAQAQQANPILQLVTQYMSQLPEGTLPSVAWGQLLDRQASAAQTMFGLAGTDEPYLYVDLPTNGRAQAGILLSESGFHIRDGVSEIAHVAWKDFPRIALSMQGNTLLIGTVSVPIQDAKVLGGLLSQLQKLVA